AANATSTPNSAILKLPCGAGILPALRAGRSDESTGRMPAPHEDSRALLGINLRPLQGSGVIDVNRLPLAEHVNACDAGLAMAIPRLLHTTERQMHFGTDRRSVHVEDAGVHVAHRRERLVHVARVNRFLQAVVHTITDRARFF